MLSVVFNYCYAKCHYAECRYAECRGAANLSTVDIFGDDNTLKPPV
jgi:hypothetical protein